MAPSLVPGSEVVTTAQDEILDLVGSIPDPEIPILTLQDLGILRGVDVQPNGRLVVTLTPTYMGCPAIDPIRLSVMRVLSEAGYNQVDIRLVLAPAWTTDWMSDEARAKLRAYGLAPPTRIGTGRDCTVLTAPAECPRCGSTNTREVSRFGATPCRAHLVCNSCLEPFDRFKAI